jgi:feruloyl esterase
MKSYKAWFFIPIITGAFSIPLHAQDAPAQACANLASNLDLEAATITSAVPVAAGRFIPPSGTQALNDLPGFCRVALTIIPTPDSDIRAEIWLPLNGWNGKFLTAGNGAWGGSIQYQALADGLRRNYATASSDTGHTTVDASFAIGHPEKLIDFGYRAVHQTAY